MKLFVKRSREFVDQGVMFYVTLRLELTAEDRECLSRYGSPAFDNLFSENPGPNSIQFMRLCSQDGLKISSPVVQGCTEFENQVSVACRELLDYWADCEDYGGEETREYPSVVTLVSARH
jgi:hypothetical protein